MTTMVRMVSNTCKKKTQHEAADVRPGYDFRFPARHSVLLRCDLYNKAGVGERQGVRPALGEARRGRQLMDKQQLFGSKQPGAARLSLFSFPRTRQDVEKKQKKAARNKAKLPSNGPFSAALPDCRGGEIHFMPPHSHCSLSVSLRHADGLVSNQSLWRANLDCEMFLANTMRFFSKFATQAKESLSLPL